MANEPYWIYVLRDIIGVYKDVIAWAMTQPDPDTAWATCHRGDWMLRLMGKLTILTKTKESEYRLKCINECGRIAFTNTKCDIVAELESAYSPNSATAVAFQIGCSVTNPDTLAACADAIRRWYPQLSMLMKNE